MHTKVPFQLPRSEDRLLQGVQKVHLDGNTSIQILHSKPHEQESGWRYCDSDFTNKRSLLQPYSIKLLVNVEHFDYFMGSQT